MPLGQHAIGKTWGGIALGWHMGWHCIVVAWGGIALGRHTIGMAWGGIALGWHTIGMAWGSIAFRWQCHPCLPMAPNALLPHAVPVALLPHAVPVALPPKSKTGRPTASWWQWVGSMAWRQVAMHLGGNTHRRQCIKNPAFTNSALTGASQLTGITKSSIVKFGNYSDGKTPY